MATIEKSKHGKIKLESDSNEFFLLGEDALLAGAFREGDALLAGVSRRREQWYKKKAPEKGPFFIP